MAKKGVMDKVVKLITGVEKPGSRRRAIRRETNATYKAKSRKRG